MDQNLYIMEVWFVEVKVDFGIGKRKGGLVLMGDQELMRLKYEGVLKWS